MYQVRVKLDSGMIRFGVFENEDQLKDCVQYILDSVDLNYLNCFMIDTYSNHSTIMLKEYAEKNGVKMTKRRS